MPLILLVVDTGSMDDILKVVVPGSMGEETTCLCVNVAVKYMA
jgi:hypothetical protein